MQLFEIYSFCRNQDDIFWDSPDISGCLDFLGLALLVPLLLKKNKIKKIKNLLNLFTGYNLQQTNKQANSLHLQKKSGKENIVREKKKGFLSQILTITLRDAFVLQK